MLLRRPHRALLGASLTLLLAAPGVAQESESAAASKAYRAGYNLVLDENWRDAVNAFDDLVRSAPRSEWADDASFWRCYAREQLGQD
ncbi:MAG: hypothetical protein AAF725_24280, partial [Acidobacteriota bacterium]